MTQSKFNRPSNMTEENFTLLKEALGYLSPKQCLVIYLRFWNNMSINEISRRIGQSWDATDLLIDSAINHLRVRIIQLSHSREETELLNYYCRLAA